MPTRLQEAQRRHVNTRTIQNDLEALVVKYTAESYRPTLVTKLLIGIAYEALAVQIGDFHTARAAAEEIFALTYAKYKLESNAAALLFDHRAPGG